MAAIRYRDDERGFRLYVDDETPISDSPIQILGPVFIDFSITEAKALLAGLERAIKDAEGWTWMEKQP